MYSERLDEAFAFAHTLHRNQRRKGSRVPYVTHLMAVGALVGEHGGDEDLVIAALLHDAMEDQGGRNTLEQVRLRFGDRVAELVTGASDAEDDPKPPWQERKETFLQRLGAAPPELKLLVAADKLHNARATVTDLRQWGAPVWDRFRGGRDGTLWYYTQALAALSQNWEHPILDDLAQAVDELRQLGQTAEAKN